jgi:hypothetical protein
VVGSRASGLGAFLYSTTVGAYRASVLSGTGAFNELITDLEVQCAADGALLESFVEQAAHFAHHG